MIVVGGRSLVAHRAILNVRCPNVFVFHIKKKTIKKATVRTNASLLLTLLVVLLKLLYPFPYFLGAIFQLSPFFIAKLSFQITLEIDERSGITRNAMEALLKFSYSANVQFFGLEAYEIVQLYHVAKIYEVCIIFN